MPAAALVEVKSVKPSPLLPLEYFRLPYTLRESICTLVSRRGTCQVSLAALAILLLDIAMQHFACVLALFQSLPNFFGQHHRAMFSAGAPESNRQIAFSLFNVVRHQVRQQAFHALQKLPGLRKRANEAAHFAVASGIFSQGRHKMWIGQKSHVEDQVGVDWHSVFIAEADHRDQHGMPVRTLESPGDEVT